MGYLSCVGKSASSCATGGGSRSGGVLVPLGTAVPWGDSQKCRAAHGPLHPAVTIPLRLCLIGSGLLFGAFGIVVWFFVWFFLVLGVEMLFGLVPFKTCPLVRWVFGVPSLFLLLFGMFAGDVFLFFFSLSLSGAGETQTPFGVWVSPCVLFLLDADFVYNPHSELRIYT